MEVEPEPEPDDDCLLLSLRAAVVSISALLAGPLRLLFGLSVLLLLLMLLSPPLCAARKSCRRWR